MKRATSPQRAGRIAGWIIAAALATGCAAGLSPAPSDGALDVAAGEVTDSSAVIWTRAAMPGVMAVSLDTDDIDAEPVRLDAGGDFTGRVAITDLEPSTRYRYLVTVTGDDGTTTLGRGSFRTAPAPDENAAVRFLFGGDLAGQNVCRDATRGFPIFATLDNVAADFFIGLGDMIYADALCGPRGAFGNEQLPGEFGLARSIPDFHAHWRYSFADPDFARLRQRMAYYAVWDDHEVINDFSARQSRRTPDGPDLLPMGLAAFLDYNPLYVPPGDSTRLHRRFRWGGHVELFVLDTRQYRDHKSAPDRAEAPKTMLGAEQRRWLIRAVSGSTATWKFIATTTPLTIPTGWPPENGRDGWADGGSGTGFERELTTILEAFREAGVTNLVWLAADVHFATGFRLQPFADDPGFVMLELITGPLHAGLFANRTVDDTLAPQRLFFHGPEDFRAVADIDEALGWMNVGLIAVDVDGAMQFDLLDGYGRVVTTQTFRPVR